MINTLRLSVLPSVITVLTNDFTLSPSSTFETTTKSPRLIQTFLLKKRMRSICYYYILSNIEVRFKQMPWTLEVKRNYNPDRTSSYSKKSIVYKHWTDCLNSRSDFFDLYERIGQRFQGHPVPTWTLLAWRRGMCPHAGSWPRGGCCPGQPILSPRSHSQPVT